MRINWYLLNFVSILVEILILMKHKISFKMSVMGVLLCGGKLMFFKFYIKNFKIYFFMISNKTLKYVCQLESYNEYFI